MLSMEYFEEEKARDGRRYGYIYLELPVNSYLVNARE